MKISELKNKVNSTVITDHNEIEQLVRDAVQLPVDSIYYNKNFGLISGNLGVSARELHDSSLADMIKIISGQIHNVGSDNAIDAFAFNFLVTCDPVHFKTSKK